MPTSPEDVARSKGISTEQVRLLQATRGATTDTLTGLSPAAVRRAIRRLSYPDLARARQRFRREQQRDDAGRIEPGVLSDALRDLGAARSRVRRRVQQVAGVPTARSVDPVGLVAGGAAGLAPDRWEWLGPGNVGGRTRSIVVHPTEPRLWAASVGGGVWHTADGGASWQPVDDGMASLAVSCLAMDPRRPQVIYAGTGEGFGNVDAIPGVGIFRTLDGRSWAHLPATGTPDFTAVNRLAIAPSGRVLLAATNAGILRSGDGDRAVWTKTLDTPVGDVKFHPGNGSRAVAGSLDSGQAFYTRNGGRTWHAVGYPSWSGRVELAYSVKNPDIVYASVQASTGEIWRSTDGGVTYSRRATLDRDGNPAPYLGDQGWYDNVIWCGDPTNQNLVVVGGINLWRSTDGGNTLAEISTWWADGSVHADHHAIVSHPGYDGRTNRTVYFGNDGGVFTAADLRAVGNDAAGPPYVDGWTELVNGYGVTQFYGGAGNVASGKIIGGAQDNGTVCYDPAGGSEQWRPVFGGDGGWCAADPSDPKVFYGEYVYLNIHRNTDGGTSQDTDGNRYISGQYWNTTRGEWDWKPPPFRIEDAKNQQALFIAPFVLDPNRPARLLAGGLQLWRTDNAKERNTTRSGPSWTVVKPSTGAFISALAITPGDSDRVWVGHQDGAVYRSVNATAPTPGWQRVDGVGPRPLTARRYCTCVTVHPTDPRTVYVAFGGYVAGNLWVTRDGGDSWTDLSQGLPPAPVRAVAVHPRRPGALYLGSEVGVWASDDAGATWSPTNQGPTNCSVDDLFWMGEVLVSATHGRGMFRIDLSGI